MNFKKPAYFSSVSILIFLSKVSTTFANGQEEHVGDIENVSGFTIDEIIRSNSIRIAIIASIILILLVIISAVIKNKNERLKKILFGLITASIVLPTLYFVFSTVYLNITSFTKGPVHWHADFRIFACNEELFLKGPESALSNRVGTPVFHSHADMRVHAEGTIAQPADISLSSFFRTIEGELTKDTFSIPTDEGLVQIKNGDGCPDGKQGTLQVFLYSTKGGVAVQTKLEDYTNYVLSSEVNIPPGDCVIFEFGETKEKTEYLCNFYEIERDKGKLEIK